jgi:hypothetical protein
MTMENRKDLIIRILISIIIGALLLIVSLRKPNDVMAPTPSNQCKEDSLQSVINQLQIDLQTEEDGWDDKEKRYSDVIFEYEFGLEHLKNYHPKAYQEFHRIIGYKESYSKETERENNKRLKPTTTNKW